LNSFSLSVKKILLLSTKKGVFLQRKQKTLESYFFLIGRLLKAFPSGWLRRIVSFSLVLLQEMPAAGTVLPVLAGGLSPAVILQRRFPGRLQGCFRMENYPISTMPFARHTVRLSG
jgi:hypothetical protein